MATQIIYRGFERVVEALVDGIERINDFFITKKKVTLTETMIFWFAFSWTAWFVIKGVYVSDEPVYRAIWVSLFAMMTIAHFVSFFFDDIIGRAYVACGYAFIWCFLAFLSAFTGSIAPALPTLLVFSMASVFIAVRLFRERRSQ